MKPTDRMLNESMAKITGFEVKPPRFCCNCGYDFVGRENPGICTKCGFETWSDIPDYCTDRNALPEVWKAVEEAGHWENFMRVLFGFQRQSYRLAFEALKAEPREHVRAALVCFNKWPWRANSADAPLLPG